MWFKPYLTQRKQQCVVNGCLSTPRNLLFGVPQGSILDLIYIKDLPNGLDFTIPCLYADDTQIFATGFDAEVLPNNMNSDLENLGDWVTVNRLQFHPFKVILQYCNAHPVLRI